LGLLDRLHCSGRCFLRLRWGLVEQAEGVKWLRLLLGGLRNVQP
jgi:hypothetical protein